jgi:hypothetical protein
MATPTVFISYRHGEPSTMIANAVYTALSAVSHGMGFELFMDQHAVEPAALFDEEILEGLGRTSHFLALLDNDYWASSYCRKELAHAVNRFENGEAVKLLFVKAGPVKPEYMTLDRDRLSGLISSVPRFRRIGDVQFLGPFDRGRRLDRLRYESPAQLGDQISELIDELTKVMP